MFVRIARFEGSSDDNCSARKNCSVQVSEPRAACFARGPGTRPSSFLRSQCVESLRRRRWWCASATASARLWTPSLASSRWMCVATVLELM